MVRAVIRSDMDESHAAPCLFPQVVSGRVTPHARFGGKFVAQIFIALQNGGQATGKNRRAQRAGKILGQAPWAFSTTRNCSCSARAFRWSARSSHRGSSVRCVWATTRPANAKAAAKFVRRSDRVLELGGGIGLISSIVAKIDGVEKVVSVEAHPGLLDVIRETQRLNDVENAELRHGVVAEKDGQDVMFYLRPDFWGSSMEPDSRPYSEAVAVRGYGLDSLIREVKPDIVISDIEGGELELFEHSDLEGVRTVIIELHPRVYGRKGQERILKAFTDRGFIIDQDHIPGTVWVLHRPDLAGLEDTTVRLGPAEHAKPDPEVTIVTCMKNEGPFILEWLAYHRSIGIGNFIVFSNDCADGTDKLLDRLDALGLVTHLPNPAIAAGSTYFQPLALKFSEGMPLMKRSDYVMCIDVDEFIAIRAGDGAFPGPSRCGRAVSCPVDE